MSLAQEMIRTTPAPSGYPVEEFATCIEACFDRAQVCVACADACLGEDMVAELRPCITTDLGCADLCTAAGRILSRQSGYDPELTRAALTACREACRRCATECARPTRRCTSTAGCARRRAGAASRPAIDSSGCDPDAIRHPRPHAVGGDAGSS